MHDNAILNETGKTIKIEGRTYSPGLTDHVERCEAELIKKSPKYVSRWIGKGNVLQVISIVSK